MIRAQQGTAGRTNGTIRGPEAGAAPGKDLPLAVVLSGEGAQGPGAAYRFRLGCFTHSA